ncbi:MAG: hypothetical protein SPI35_00075 [Porphyromonas sp.]|nr:hypothetical protein [Porphyromonas sp.]
MNKILTSFQQKETTPELCVTVSIDYRESTLLNPSADKRSKQIQHSTLISELQNSYAKQ